MMSRPVKILRISVAALLINYAVLFNIGAFQLTKAAISLNIGAVLLPTAAVLLATAAILSTPDADCELLQQKYLILTSHEVLLTRS